MFFLVEKPDLTRLMMGALIVFLIVVIIGLVVKIWKLQTGTFKSSESMFGFVHSSSLKLHRCDGTILNFLCANRN